MKATNFNLLYGAVIVGGLVLVSRKASAAVDALASGVNPLDRGNWAYRATNAVGSLLDDGIGGDGSFILGNAVYEAGHQREIWGEIYGF
ncbi:hypothetical protein JYT97_03835 [Haliea sp. AH-315-K21]|uniref:Uncharacterized protein n=1 Tax=SAR86 cluster bacterium TaxID=2030880 RepID=A0A2A5CDX4_9GAMM|nr:hypothetical protein [Haliea sp. AH-315-K21]PCJ42084.1 MAG: hypothetical protein COA71_05695 [SAR86 cluster bacterium]